MDMMNADEAREIIEGMRDTAVTDCVNLKNRIVTLKDEYSVDPWEETTKQIQRLEQRLERRVRESEALAIAIAAVKFHSAVAG